MSELAGKLLVTILKGMGYEQTEDENEVFNWSGDTDAGYVLTFRIPCNLISYRPWNDIVQKDIFMYVCVSNKSGFFEEIGVHGFYFQDDFIFIDCFPAFVGAIKEIIEKLKEFGVPVYVEEDIEKSLRFFSDDKKENKKGEDDE